MFEELTEKFEQVFKKLRGQGKLREKNIEESMREVRRALLEADVNYKIAKDFIKNVKEKSLGAEVLGSITPGQKIIKIIHDEMVELLGGVARELNFRGNPMVIMLCGLQGSGKTTTAAKLAVHARSRGRRPLLMSVDIHRPAAIDQLRILSKSIGIDFFEAPPGTDATEIAKKGLKKCSSTEYDMLIIDTAGRLHVDNEMMNELECVKNTVNPQEVLFVADGMTGQDAVRAVQGFGSYIDFNGVILTKLDGDARGGAALSIKAATGKPIRYIGIGEKTDALDVFHPERMASRILGMGDIVSLVEKAEEVIDEKEAERLRKKIAKNQFTLEDFQIQLKQLKKMGSLKDVMAMIPGAHKMLKKVSPDENEMSKVEAIISSMTVQEKREPHIIDGSRRRRIAMGSGTSVQDVNRLLKQFRLLEKMMNQASKMNKLWQGFNIPMRFT